MERASGEVIAELLTTYSPVGKTQRQDTARRTRAGRRLHCQCGQCPQCKETAHWERIFTEKFADPAYYSLRIPRSASPLESL